MKTILLLFSIAVFLTYLISVYFRVGITDSISATWYDLKGNNKYLYSLFILGVAIPIMIVANCPLGWLAGGLLCLDSAAPAGGDKTQNLIHCFGADAGIAIGMLMLGFTYHLWYLPAVFLAFSLIMTKRKILHATYWIEVTAFVLIMAGMFINL